MLAAALVAVVALGCAGRVRGGLGADDVASGGPAVEASVRTISYDDHPDTVLDVHRPTTEPSGLTVALVHGGFWREQYRRDLMAPLVPSLLADGHLVVNLEYRRVGGGGGWPTTLVDVAAAIDAVGDLEGVDADRVVTVGHSAGGHLALWAAARHRLPPDAPGAAPRVVPCHVIAQAGVVVLGDALAAGLGSGAAVGLLGGEHPDRARLADPAVWLPLDVPVTLVHAPGDTQVPLAQSERWVELATAAGDRARLVTAPGDHFSVIDPDHELWSQVVAALRDGC